MFVITWNIQRGRMVAGVRRELYALLFDWGPAVLALQEAGGYAELLKEVADGADYRLIQFSSAPGQKESAVLVRKDVALGQGQQWAARMTWRGWNRQTGAGGMTAPKWAPTLLADGVRFVVVHFAPSVRHHRRGLPTGPPLRVLSYITYARRLVALLATMADWRPTVTLGDFNATATVYGRWSPRWIARQAGMRTHAPARPTSKHRQDGPVDFVLARNCRITKLRTLENFEHGSDHEPVGYQVLVA